MIEEMRTLAEELSIYAAEEESEWGEINRTLSTIGQYNSIQYAGEEFQIALLNEIKDNLNYAREHAVIRKETVTDTHTYVKQWVEWDY